jgi:LysM repeat protein
MMSAGGTPTTSTAAAAPSEAGSSQASDSYTVQAGDTLSGIALRLGVSEAQLMQTNSLTDANAVFAGQRLRLPASGQASFGAARLQAPLPAPNGRRYLIRPGDTLSAIALRLGVAARDLAAANQLTDTNHVVAGRYLQLPAVAGVAAAN